ncbi:MAG: hypothetical protein KDD38_03755 [Bdellovibrionales bacterium]|nr:hypothetical protein [Bdellovibrionales bacterium]
MLILILFCASSIAWTHSAHAQDIGGSQFGILYGFSVPDSDNSNPHRMYGAKGIAFISPSMTIGGYYFLTGSEQGSGGGEQFDYSLHGLEAALQIPGSAGTTFVGFRAGIAKVSTDTFGTPVIFSPYHYGFASGYNYNVATWFTVGFEGSFLYAEKSSTTKASVPYELESFSVLTFLLSLQFRL